jgi:hypothetical protein
VIQELVRTRVIVDINQPGKERVRWCNMGNKKSIICFDAGLLDYWNMPRHHGELDRSAADRMVLPSEGGLTVGPVSKQARDVEIGWSEWSNFV